MLSIKGGRYKLIELHWKCSKIISYLLSHCLKIIQLNSGMTGQQTLP